MTTMLLSWTPVGHCDLLKEKAGRRALSLDYVKISSDTSYELFYFFHQCLVLYVAVFTFLIQNQQFMGVSLSLN
jgi:hypothetical protein